MIKDGEFNAHLMAGIREETHFDKDKESWHTFDGQQYGRDITTTWDGKWTCTDKSIQLSAHVLYIHIPWCINKSQNHKINHAHTVSCRLHNSVNVPGSDLQLTEFSGSGRTGRRNALPNILQQSVASIGTSAITEMLDQMTCAGGAGGAGGGAAGGGSTNGTERTHPDEQMGACGGGAEETHNQRLNHSWHSNKDNYEFPFHSIVFYASVYVHIFYNFLSVLECFFVADYDSCGMGFVVDVFSMRSLCATKRL